MERDRGEEDSLSSSCSDYSDCSDSSSSAMLMDDPAGPTKLETHDMVGSIPHGTGSPEAVWREKPVFTKQTHHFYPSIQAITYDFNVSANTVRKLLSDRQCPFGQAFTKVKQGYWIANRAWSVIGKGKEYPFLPRG